MKEMKTTLPQKIFAAATLLILTVPAIVFAHQPNLVNQDSIRITDPELSRAFYGTVQETPHTYTITSATDFHLYVNLLVPDLPSQSTDVRATILKDEQEIAQLGGSDAPWEKYFEPFGYDHYLQVPEYQADVAAGTYSIVVTSEKPNTKYSLAVGEREEFDAASSYEAVKVMPELKRSFFNESPATFLLSPFGIGYVVIIFALSFLFGFAYRFILKRIAKTNNRKRTKNIGKGDKLVRIAIGVVLFALAVTTTWSPFLFFFSGFAFFEAIFSWCGFYAALGKNTCPL